MFRRIMILLQFLCVISITHQAIVYYLVGYSGWRQLPRWEVLGTLHLLILLIILELIVSARHGLDETWPGFIPIAIIVPIGRYFMIKNPQDSGLIVMLGLLLSAILLPSCCAKQGQAQGEAEPPEVDSSTEPSVKGHVYFDHEADVDDLFTYIADLIRERGNIDLIARALATVPWAFTKTSGNHFATLLQEAIQYGNEEVVHFLVVEQRVIINLVNWQSLTGQTPLFTAARIHKRDVSYRMILFLLKNGADPKIEDTLSATFEQYCSTISKLQPQVRDWLEELENTGSIAEEIPDFGSASQRSNPKEGDQHGR